MRSARPPTLATTTGRPDPSTRSTWTCEVTTGAGTGLNPAVEYHVVNSLGWSQLRPLQLAAVEPVHSGADCLIVAPTAGGKTEAAVFPLLSTMVEQEWPVSYTHLRAHET